MTFNKQYGSSSSGGFTLVEVATAMGIAGLVLGGIILGYVQMLHRAEWSAYSLAAHSLAQQGMEQARAAKWDTLAYPLVDQLVQSNFPEQLEVLDVPLQSQRLILATNFITISTVRSNPPLKSVQVDCVWAYHNGRLFTNRVVTYRAPDQ